MSRKNDDNWEAVVKIAMLFVAMCAFMMWISGCTAMPVTSTPPKAALPAWSYDAFVAAHVTPEMLAASPGDLCPNGSANMQFWQALVHATVDAESGGNPNDDYTEAFTADSGVAQVSSGLLQLSLDDAKRGGNCAGLSPATIHQAEPNLACGMEIMALLLGTRTTMRASLGRYWSTIRDGKTDTAMEALLPQCFEVKADKSEMTDPGEAR